MLVGATCEPRETAIALQIQILPVATKRDTFLSGQNPNSVNILSVSLAIRYCILKCKLFAKNRERFDPCTGPEVYKSLGSLP